MFCLKVWEGVFIFFSTITLFFFSFLFCRLLFGLLVQLVFQSPMTDPLFNSTSAPPNTLLDLNLNMNLNPENMVQDVIYNVKYRHPDMLYDPVLFESLKQIKVIHALF